MIRISPETPEYVAVQYTGENIQEILKMIKEQSYLNAYIDNGNLIINGVSHQLKRGYWVAVLPKSAKNLYFYRKFIIMTDSMKESYMRVVTKNNEK